MSIYHSNIQRKNENYKPTRLYIKKLNNYYYFGKTSNQNIELYHGSGVVWKKIIKKHGKENIKTLWVSDWYYDADEIRQVALHFSEENNIIESLKWANCKLEDGLDGGAQPKHIVEKTASKLKGKKHSEEQRKAKSERQRGKKKSEEWVNKRIGSIYKKHKEWEIFGENHWNSDKTLYEFENIHSGEKVIALKSTFNKMIGGGHVNRIITGERKTTKGWRFIRLIY
jgi:hypothetical protein